MSGVDVKWLIGGVFGALYIGGLVGRLTAPQPSVQVETKVEEKIVEVEKERVVEVEVERAAETKTLVVYRDRVVNVDGSVRETETIRAEEVKVEIREVEKVVEKLVEVKVDRLVTERIEVRQLLPQWRVGLGAEAAPMLPLEPLIRLSAGRRLAGPVWLEINATATTAAEFQTVGVGLALEF